MEEEWLDLGSDKESGREKSVTTPWLGKKGPSITVLWLEKQRETRSGRK